MLEEVFNFFNNNSNRRRNLYLWRHRKYRRIRSWWSLWKYSNELLVILLRLILLKVIQEVLVQYGGGGNPAAPWRWRKPLQVQYGGPNSGNGGAGAIYNRFISYNGWWMVELEVLVELVQDLEVQVEVEVAGPGTGAGTAGSTNTGGGAGGSYIYILVQTEDQEKL